MSQIPITSSFSDFWLTDDMVEKHVDKKKPSEFTTDLIQLAAFRRVISNYVCILTNKNIPVHFSDSDKDMMNFTDGSVVWLSSSVKRKTDFDWSVGIALHEGAHIVLSDFDVVKKAFLRIPLPIPSSLRDIAKKRNVTTDELAYFCKMIFNYVEDRYIDTYIFREAPGYRGYYSSMYKKLWNSNFISRALKSKAFRLSNLRSYEFRVINLTNPATDLDALPALREIVDVLDMENILRLKTTRDRLNMSYKIVEIIIGSLGKRKKIEDHSNNTLKKIHDVFEEHFEIMGSGKSTSQKSTKNKTKDGIVEENEPSNIDDVINETVSKLVKSKKDGGKDDGDLEDIDPYSPGDVSEFSKNQLSELKKDFKKQQDMLKHDYRNIKEHVSTSEKSMLDVIEKYGIILVPTGTGLTSSKNKSDGGDSSIPSVDCIVVQNLTKELIDAGTDVFPMSLTKSPFVTSPTELDTAVSSGFSLGRVLGKKLQVRGEINITKYIRKNAGKIERRLLAGIGAGLTDIFNKTITHKYNKARLHISVDASSSMLASQKWHPTMTCLTAICVASSMVENLKVSVSFRCTHKLTDGTELPYVVLAYDSTKDKISKIRQLFPLLSPCGCTPEGLAFEAIMKNFIVGKKSDEQDHYFVNISDGEPFYTLRSNNPKYKHGFSYTSNEAANHTKRQIEKIRAQGVNVLSYFIRSDYSDGDSYFSQTNYKDTLKKQFETMYGKTAQFINVTNVFDIAKTMNQLFLSVE